MIDVALAAHRRRPRVLDADDADLAQQRLVGSDAFKAARHFIGEIGDAAARADEGHLAQAVRIQPGAGIPDFSALSRALRAARFLRRAGRTGRPADAVCAR
ncbi:hypothetical protein [Chromobacterium violaceum]|uniref:hypothetical protein n=1 Tax=Chromobacterium violaceum TaxID=536 RepID=UPI003CC8148A